MPQNISPRAQALHRDAVIIDPCVQYLIKRTPRSDRAGLTAVGLTIPMPGDDLAQALPRVTDFLDVISREPAFCLADTPAAIRRAKRERKTAHILLAQDALMLGANARNVILWKQLGLRVCQLTYNEQSLLGSGCLEPNDGGLSQLGAHMLKELQRVGITVDLTHAGARTFMDVCKLAQAPLIASHSNPAAVVPNPRNISDAQIKAVADTGGVVCITTWAPLIWRGNPAVPTLDDHLRCIEHVINLVGIDHAGISTDSVGTTGAYPVHPPDPNTISWNSVTGDYDRVANPPDTNNRQPSDFNGIEDYPWLVEKLVRAGYRDDEIGKLLGENLMRVFEATWKPEFFA